MKIRLFLSLVLVFILKNVEGQSNRFGVHAITNYSHLKVDSDIFPGVGKSDMKLGIGLGIGFDVFLHEKIELKPELNWLRKGGQYDVNFTDENGGASGPDQLKFYLDYFSLPVLIKHNFGNKIKVAPFVGSAINFLINVKYNQYVIIDGNRVLFPVYNDIDKYHRFDQSVIAGVESDIPLGGGLSLMINVRIDHGLMEGAKNNFILIGENRSLLLMTGIKF